MRVPWLAKEAISRKAGIVIADYEAEAGRRIAPPIPIEELIEFGLKLALVFEDLRGKLGLPDVLGATYAEFRTISADLSLDRPEGEGRLSFTLAHEAGHWVMHRRFIKRAHRPGRSIFCRTRDARTTIEWQADYFAACLLMPGSFVRAAFDRVCGPQPLVLYNVESAYCGPICFDPCVANWPQIAERVRAAGRFDNVSKQAMIIRLQELGLVQNETHAPLAWR